ncbi:hypothetical protein BGW80DRAFT_1374100 [Lactifluus volemus]|nr:hypothetical protein BGW80DRAFT_1374100 [Lactifluus volemus]
MHQPEQRKRPRTHRRCGGLHSRQAREWPHHILNPSRRGASPSNRYNLIVRGMLVSFGEVDEGKSPETSAELTTSESCVEESWLSPSFIPRHTMLPIRHQGAALML